MKSEFVHLHNHSDYSLLDGAQTVQTLVNTIDDLGMDSVALTEHGNLFSVIPYYKSAKKAGASAALLVTPYYNRPTQKGLLEHYKLIANEVDLAQILYNVPSRTTCDLLPETVSELSKEKNIVGLKEASPDPGRLEELKTSLSDDNFLLYSGDDLTACSFMLQGGHGTISVTANIVPDKISRISELALKKDISASDLDKDLEKLHENLFIESSPIPVKWALNKMGIIPEGIRLPLCSLDEVHHEELNEVLYKLKLID